MLYYYIWCNIVVIVIIISIIVIAQQQKPKLNLPEIPKSQINPNLLLTQQPNPTKPKNL